MELLQVMTEWERLLAVYWELRPRRVLEIGSWDGGSIHGWLTYGAPNLRLFAIDLEHHNAGMYPKWRTTSQRITTHTGSSWDPPAKQFVADNAPYDWGFIDADHGDHGVRTDLATVRPHVRKGGVIVFHDIQAGSDYQGQYAPGVVVDELEAEGLRVDRFVDAAPRPESHGLAVVYV
jgi:predicted O-methyltransferase YrrM